MPIAPDTDYDLARPDILDQLHGDSWFVDCFTDFFEQIGRQWDCKVTCSPARLLDACSLYHEDIQRTLKFGMNGKQDEAVTSVPAPFEQSAGELDAASLDTEAAHPRPEAEPSLDHFKHGAFLTYWLKRSLPINTIDYLDADGTAIAHDLGYEPTHQQAFFTRYGNEYCALLAGFKIVLNYQLQLFRERYKGSEEDKMRDLERILDSTQLPDRFVHEFPRLLKHKNISPHALYMTFCALYERVADGL